MSQKITLKHSDLPCLRSVDPRMVSYNVEMAEVTGGTFWKAYTPEQIAGTGMFPPIKNLDDINGLMEVYPPINLYNKKLQYLARSIGPAWVRVSGTWATKTYYDFEGITDGEAPDGYQNVLTKKQWIGVLDFVKAIGARLLVSVSNCAGLRTLDQPWNPSQAEKLFALSKEYGVPIDAAEFMNEPNMLEQSGAPSGYTPKHFSKDQDIFFKWLNENYPDVLRVGPCTTGGDAPLGEKGSGGVPEIMKHCTTAELLDNAEIVGDVFSYHCYNGVSERLACLMPEAHWLPEEAITDDYLEVSGLNAEIYGSLRNRYYPDADMWVTEAGDAGGGGNTWASTYLDVFRTLNELGSFSRHTRGVIFHNTLASSDYGYLMRESFEPRPSYFAVVLWNRLMGTTVYDTGEPIREGAHIFAHSRKDGKAGTAYLIINNSTTASTFVELPEDTDCYMLSAQSLRAPVMQLNGKDLLLHADYTLPEMAPVLLRAGTIELPPASNTFLVL